MPCLSRVLLALALVFPFSPSTARALSRGPAQAALARDTRVRLITAVVEIVPLDATGEEIGTVGSGTIVSPDGHILTNFHVIGDSDTRQVYADFAILMTRPEFFDQPPQYLYRARYVASDPTHDLAILRIDRNADASTLDPSRAFASVPVGSSNETMPGDPITIIGYPGISGRTITFTAGVLSGWVGEDFETGGKQWIKTDAKITHGNSGGAAVNERGELTGVPTAGRTLRYPNEPNAEEQAYVRPIGLAWALLGPHVASVTRAESTPSTTLVSVPTQTQPAQPVAEAAAEGTGDYGEVELGGTRTAVIATDSVIVIHGYTVNVPAGLQSLIIRVDGSGSDVDLAVKAGSPITSYAPKDEGGDYDFLDTSEETSAVYTYDSPAPGTVYVDVLNLTLNALRYALAVEATWPSGVMGALALGETAVGTLSDPQTPRYHTYYVDVPLNAPELVISMEADVDLDLAVKFGSEIASWAERSQGGDWDYIDEDASHSAAFTIPNPRPGRWYIDVFTRYDATGQYRLTVR